VICIGSLPGAPCLEEATVSPGCSNWETYRRGLSELEGMVDSIKRYNGDGSLTIDYRPLNSIIGPAKRVAKHLAGKHGMSVRVRAGILPYSDTPGHMGGLLSIGVCVPGSHGVSALAPRIALLHSILAGERIPIPTPPHAEIAREKSPFSPIYKPIHCYMLKIWETGEAPREERYSIKERLSDYTLAVEESELYPADPDNERELRIEQLLPEYRSGWACTREAMGTLGKAGYKIHRPGTRKLILARNNTKILIKCGRRTDKIVLLRGEKRELHHAIKTLLDYWIENKTNIPEPFKQAYKRAGSPSEIIETTLELQDYK